MIDVKNAVKAARDRMVDLYAPETLNDLLLEEVTLSDDDRYWLVTFGFTQEPATSAGSYAGVNPVRKYKVLKVDANTGQVQSMQIRETSAAT